MDSGMQPVSLRLFCHLVDTSCTYTYPAQRNSRDEFKALPDLMDPQVNQCFSHMMNNLSDTPRHEHFTPDLHALRWPPVRLRIDFELLMFVLKVPKGLAPPRLSGISALREQNRTLRSSKQVWLEVLRSRCKHQGFL